MLMHIRRSCFIRISVRLVIGLLLGSLIFAYSKAVNARPLVQIPTVAVPTVTGTPKGSMASVRSDIDQDQINVRAGPDTSYEIIGVLLLRQEMPALGRSVGGNWVQIAYPGVQGGVGWVYAPYVNVTGELPLVEPPPTPTPRTTPTIDPTLAAQFIVALPPTRLPTFTQPPPLVIPTFQTGQAANRTNIIPVGFVIVGLAVVGFFGVIISLLGRR
jgi:hypothetical protein